MTTASTFLPLKGEKRWAYLTREKSIRVASIADDGSIYLSPLWFVVSEKRIYIPLDAGSRHGANAEAGRCLSALVDSGDEYSTVHGVRIIGKLVRVTDQQHVDELQQLVFDKYFYVGHPYADSYFQFGVAAERTYFELVADKMIGWDMREVSLPQVAEARVLPDFVVDRFL